jgi:D-3-phosphoglycerate dehydrogenase
LSDRPRVLVREPIAEAGIDLLRERFDVDVDPNGDLAERIADYEGIVIRSATKLDADVIGRAHRLKVIGRAGVGVDNVDVDAATRRGIVVANAPESTVVSAAEHTIGLILALSRNIAQAHASLKQGRWERSAHGGIELAGKTLGVLGFGRIGQQVARRALGLEMRVVAVDPFVARERFRELGVERADSAEEVLAAADFLTLHLPLTSETTHYLDAQAFARMRDGVRLINAARGELVDEDALLEALHSGKVAAAALDVFSAEPYSGPLLALDNVVVTPHLAASTEEAQDRAGVIVAEQVAAALEGALVTNAVNIPSIAAEDLEVLGPFIPLAATLGRLVMELAGGRADRIELAYYGSLAGYDTRLLTVAALNGAFQGRSDQPVNYVNAPVIAAERGVEVVEERRRASRDFTNLVRVSLRANGDELRVAGTTIGREHRRWLVSALGFELEMELAPLMAFFRYDDVPGVIGKVGTLFGEAGVNIANMAVSRTRRGDKALMALSIDSPAPDELVDTLRAAGFDDAYFISLSS